MNSTKGEGYNGWSNRETWLVNLWFYPETRDDLEYIKEELERQISELPGFLQDMISLGSTINWEELEAALDLEDEED